MWKQVHCPTCQTGLPPTVKVGQGRADFCCSDTGNPLIKNIFNNYYHKVKTSRAAGLNRKTCYNFACSKSNTYTLSKGIENVIIHY